MRLCADAHKPKADKILKGGEGSLDLEFHSASVAPVTFKLLALLHSMGNFESRNLQDKKLGFMTF